MKTKLTLFTIICTIFLAVGFVVSFVSVSALDLGLSPSKMNLNGSTGDKICGNFTLSTTAIALDLSVEDKWTEQADSKNLNDYTKPASDYKIESKYLGEINLSGKKKFEFCVTMQKPGIYNGVLIFRSKTIAGLGMWIKAEIGGMDLEKSGSPPITGSSIGDSGIKKYLWPLLISTVVSLIALIFLIRHSKKKSKENDGSESEDDSDKNKEGSGEKSDWDEEEED